MGSAGASRDLKRAALTDGPVPVHRRARARDRDQALTLSFSALATVTLTCLSAGFVIISWVCGLRT